MKPILIAVMLVFAIQSTAYALPLPKQQLTPERLMQMQPSGNFRAANFRAIVALNNCSGSLVRYENSIGSDPAMVLTNGHCLGGGGFLKPGEIRIDTPANRTMALLNNDGTRQATLTADRVLFATMTKTDITLYRLTETYDQIMNKYKVQALTISSKHPELKTPIAVVSGFWKKIYSCQIDKFIFALKEADWTMLDSARYTQPGCETIGGTSGSPIINTNTYEVVGINNTHNDKGARCTMNNPCEVDQNGNVTVVNQAAYGQQTYVLYSCLNEKRQINLNLPSCMLRPTLR